MAQIENLGGGGARTPVPPMDYWYTKIRQTIELIGVSFVFCSIGQLKIVINFIEVFSDYEINLFD